MSYQTHTFQPNTTLTAAALNEMDDQIAANEAAISGIDGKIPEAASSNNKLADTAAVASAIDAAKEVFWATYGTTAAAQLNQAITDNKLIICKYSNRYYFYYCKNTSYTGGSPKTTYYFTAPSTYYGAGNSPSNVVTTPYISLVVTSGSSVSEAWDHGSVDLAPIASPNFTGTPKAPTAVAGTDTTQIATTAFVNAAVAAAALGALHPAGSVAFANLPALAAANLNHVYNITDAFATTSDFVEGAGSAYPAGTNVAIINTGSDASPVYKYDVYSGFVDLSAYRTASAQDVIDNAQDAAITAKYSKPSSGIPETDLDAAVQDKLNGATVTVDSALSESSTNPVQNKVIKAALDSIAVYQESANIFDPSRYTQADYLDSSLIQSSGAITTEEKNNSYLVTCKIPITAGKTYTFTPSPWVYATLSAGHRGRCYTDSDTPCSQVAFVDNGDDSYTFTAPENASYIRFSRFKGGNAAGRFAESVFNFEHNFRMVEGNIISDTSAYFDPYMRLAAKVPPENLLNPSFTLPPLYGKKVVNFGDSIFGNTRPPRDLSSKIAEYTGATVYNCAFSGCRMAVHSGHWDAFSMYRLAYAVAHDDFSVQDAALEYDDRTSYAEEPLTTLEAVDFDEVDMITIAYGTNDLTSGAIPLDNDQNDMDTSTLAGALRYSLDQLLTAYPTIRIVVLGTIYRNVTSGGVTVSGDDYVNTLGLTQAQINAKLKAVCEEYHIKYMDNSDIGINSYTIATYLSDGTHPSAAGIELYARHIANSLHAL